MSLEPVSYHIHMVDGCIIIPGVKKGATKSAYVKPNKADSLLALSDFNPNPDPNHLRVSFSFYNIHL